MNANIQTRNMSRKLCHF